MGHRAADSSTVIKLTKLILCIDIIYLKTVGTKNDNGFKMLGKSFSCVFLMNSDYIHFKLPAKSISHNSK